MDYVSLGRTGLRVSRICLGMMSYGPHEERPWALAEEAAEPIVRRAVESGVTAQWFGTVPSVVIGGMATVVVVAVMWMASSSLREWEV